MGLVTASPASFIAMLTRNHMFDRSNQLYWNLSKLFPVTVTRLKLSGAAAYNAAVSHLSAGSKVLLQVATDRGTLHWVVASKALNGDIEVRDPNGGRVGLLSSLYGVHSLRGLAAITQH
jgi:hypothetical protein